MDGVEARFDARAHHIRKRDAQRAAEHEIRHDAQARQENAEAEKEDR